MKKFSGLLDVVIRLIVVAAMLVLLVDGTWRIFTCWILKNPPTFTNESPRYTLIWAPVLGSAHCFYKNGHLVLNLVKDRMEGSVRSILMIFIEAVVLSFVCYVFIYSGIQLASNATNKSSMMRIPLRLLYACLPISDIFIVIARVIKYMQLFIDSKGGE